jgi:hypothetical protein
MKNFSLIVKLSNMRTGETVGKQGLCNMVSRRLSNIIKHN